MRLLAGSNRGLNDFFESKVLGQTFRLSPILKLHRTYSSLWSHDAHTAYIFLTHYRIAQKNRTLILSVSPSSWLMNVNRPVFAKPNTTVCFGLKRKHWCSSLHCFHIALDGIAMLLTLLLYPTLELQNEPQTFHTPFHNHYRLNAFFLTSTMNIKGRFLFI